MNKKKKLPKTAKIEKEYGINSNLLKPTKQSQHYMDLVHERSLVLPK